MKNIKKHRNILLLLTITIISLSVNAQVKTTPTKNATKNTEHSYTIDHLDMIYVDEESENIHIQEQIPFAPTLVPQKNNENVKSTPDTLAKAKRSEHPMKKKFFDINDDNEEDDDEDDDDNSEESEYEILYASFDTNAIHYPKSAFASNSDTIVTLPLFKNKKEKFVNPAESYHISSRFAPRRRRFHYGIDLAMPTGKPVYSAFNGTVRVAKRNRSYGNLVVVRHDNGLETYYAHLSKIEVHCGQQVKAGELIGLCGNTGRSFGSHLHFEIRYLGSAMNPDSVIDFNTQQLKNDTLFITSKYFRHHKGKAQYAKNKSGKNGKGRNYHTVRKGDTLGHIAARNHTTVKKLCRLNGIKETSTLRLGQKIRIR